jgi:hypothetical protein
MAYDTWGGTWGTTWAVSWTRDSLPVATTQDVGGGGRPGTRRRRYIIDDRPLRLTDDELEALLKRLLENEPPVSKRKIKRIVVEALDEDKALAAQKPQFVIIRDRLLAAKEYEAAQKVREIAQRIAEAEDEADIEMLLLH